MQTLNVKFKGIDTLLVNNPQTSDPLNKYAKEHKRIYSKRSKTDEDVLKMREIELRSKIYWDDEIGLYVPSTWVLASITGISWARGKVSKTAIRSAVFPSEPKLKLEFEGSSSIKEPIDIVKNDKFHNVVSLKQGQNRLVKASPIFHKWSFRLDIDFDPSVINENELKDLITHGAMYGGFGDFRPTHGRATVEFQ
ncbi:conserved hypothetical protein [uncultured Thiomicrorhabdus sp.]